MSTADSALGGRLPQAVRRAVRPATVLTIASIGVFMAFMDDTVVGIAFPNLVRSFPHASFANLSWVLNGYYISFAVLLIPSGRLADLIGRRRMFSAGVLVFTIASAACAAAPSVGALIAARVIQGMGAAMIVPASLALVLEAHPSQGRTNAVGIWGATAALAAGLGPAIGGLLVNAYNWRLVFLVNLPVGIVAWRLTARHLVESRAPGRRELPDATGFGLLAVALAAVSFAIVQGPESGWSSGTVLGAACAAAVASVLLVRRVRSHPSATLDGDLLRMPGMTLNGVITVVGSAGFFALGLANLLYLMQVWRYSPLTAGLATTPAPFLAAAAAVLAGRLAGRVDPRRMITLGALIWSAGPLVLLARMGPTPDYLGAYLPAALLLGAGVGIVFPLTSDAAVSGAPRGRFGEASALNGTIRQLAATIGVAILAALIGSAAKTGTPSPFHRAWTFAAVCFGLVAVASLAMRPFKPIALEDERSGARSRDWAHGASPKRPISTPTARPAAPPANDEALLAGVALFSALPAELVRKLVAGSQPLLVRAGKWLFREGDAADAMYVVRSGRLEVMGEVVGRPAETMRELGPGAAVGELALVTGAPRSASIRARRDATVLRLPKQSFDELLREDSAFASTLARVLGGELQRSRRIDETAAGGAKTLAVVSLSPDLAGIEASLVQELTQLCPTAQLNSDGSADLETDQIGSYVARMLDELEREHHIVVLLAGPLGAGAWAQACLRQADRVLALASGPCIQQLESMASLEGCDAALLVDTDEPGVAEVLEAIRPRSTQRIRGGDARSEDVARLARRIAGCSTGLVLSGGGARAFAHIGAIEALVEAGIAIDRVGGASTGAFIGALLAQDLDPPTIDARCYEEWVRRDPLADYRFPRVSLLRGRRLATMLERNLPGRIEDLPRPFYCVSTDVIGGELTVHRGGALARAVEASMCLPGMLPPVRIADSFHIDGGVLDNLPIEPMIAGREGPIIICDVARPERYTEDRKEPLYAPGMFDTLSRMAQLTSGNAVERARAQADLVITPAQEHVGAMEFHAIDVMREAGRRAALHALEAAPPELAL
jgi:NTE family protein